MNPMIIGALAGLAMGELSKQEADKETRAMEKYNKDVVLPVEREKQRYAYWTGTQGQLPGRVPHASRMKEWMKGAATGAVMGQGFDSPTPSLTGDEMPGRWEDPSKAGGGSAWESVQPQEGDPNFRGPPRSAMMPTGSNLTDQNHGIDGLSNTASGYQPKYSPGSPDMRGEAPWREGDISDDEWRELIRLKAGGAPRPDINNYYARPPYRFRK